MISVFDLFKIGIGPSSSHTVGPMKAAHQFVAGLAGVPGPIARIEVTLLGSLAWTGMGHGTDKAVMLGLAGEQPDTVDPDQADAIVAALARGQKLILPGASARSLRFDPARDIVFDRKTAPPRHPNTLALPRAWPRWRGARPRTLVLGRRRLRHPRGRARRTRRLGPHRAASVRQRRRIAGPRRRSRTVDRASSSTPTNARSVRPQRSTRMSGA